MQDSRWFKYLNSVNKWAVVVTLPYLKGVYTQEKGIRSGVPLLQGAVLFKSAVEWGVAHQI